MGKKYFKDLNYSLGDEDSRVELGILPLKLNSVAAIAGSGGRVLPLLAKYPANLFCVDIVEEQLKLTEFRISALKQFTYEDYLGVLGYPPYAFSPNKRKEVIKGMELSASCREYIEGICTNHNWTEIIYYGKFEKTLIKFSKFIRLILGNEIEKIFQLKSSSDRQVYFDSKFPFWKWKIILFLLGNSAVLNSILYKGEFPKKNLKKSSYKIYEDIFNSLFYSYNAKESFFLQLVLLGKLKFQEGNPIECDSLIYNKAKDAIKSCNISYIKGDILSDLPGAIDFISLSDVPSFFKNDKEKSFLQDLKTKVNNSSYIIVRAHMRVPNPELNGFSLINDQYDDLLKEERTQLWKFFIYKN